VDEQLRRSYGRWQQAEAEAREDEADEMFGVVFRSASLAGGPVPPRFTAGTMDAVARAAAADARRAYRLRTYGVPAALAGVALAFYFLAGHLAALVSTIVVSSLNLLIALVVGVTADGAGSDLWSILSAFGKATAALLSNPGFTAVVLAIQGLALVALVTLQRLLRSDEELFR
jgi:hypothetical protein